jgi:protein tyrosine/serine phosphatase
MKIYQAKIRSVLACVAFIGLIAGAYFGYMEEQGNFHPITAGEAYRSAQMDPDELEYYIHRFGIRSIINLRGKGAGKQWYTDEVTVSKKDGLKHYDLGLDAKRAPTRREVRQLLDLFRAAPRPVLIHCKAGADRSGLAAALWKMVIDGASKSVAEEQLSIRFGHMPFGPTQAMDTFLENWKRSNQARNEFPPV